MWRHLLLRLQKNGKCFFHCKILMDAIWCSTHTHTKHMHAHKAHAHTHTLLCMYTAFLISLWFFLQYALLSFIPADRRGAKRRYMWEAHVGYSCACTDRRVLCRWMGPSMVSHACLGAYPCRQQQQRFRLQTCLLFHSIIKLLSTVMLHFPFLLFPSYSVSLILCFCLLDAYCCMAVSRQRELGEFPASWRGAGCSSVFREYSSHLHITWMCVHM